MNSAEKRQVEVFIEPAAYENCGSDYWKGKTAVVIDVLRATSTMVTALAEGCAWILPCREMETATVRAKDYPGALLAGERGGLPPGGFQKGNSPREFLAAEVAGKGVILTTTNGTRALDSARSADKLLVASFLNIQSTVRYLHAQSSPLVLICSGTGEDFALEDALLAGALLDSLAPSHPFASLYRAYAGILTEAVRSSRNGRRLQQLGLEEDIIWCLKKDHYDIVVQSDKSGFLRILKNKNR
jgi:2-phosphosulfolactate phosphatase